MCFCGFYRPTKVSKHPQPVRFFSRESMVTDWYRGQLSSALSRVNSVDVSFVMYYAPWDAESQYVRGEFEKAAEILSDRVRPLSFEQSKPDICYIFKQNILLLALILL